MFVPYTVRGVTLPNRVAVSPMAMYSAEDGLPNDFHLVHLGQRALGGAGMVFTEMTCVAPDARITPGCAGLWTDEQGEAYARVVRFIHENSPAKAALQLGHAGPKGSVKKPWEAPDDITPLDGGNWPLLAPSAVPYTPKNQTPKAMTREDMDRVRDEFAAAARRGAGAGFDWLELHCAHGYLLSAFLSPLTNHRTDDYGGPVENRVRYPLEVWDAVRAVWPAEKPMSVRISAVDWVDGGNTVEDAVAIARAFADHGADLVDVSTGQVSTAQRPVYGRMWQTPFAERIRLETGMATMAVGNIYEPDHVNSILAAGRADLCLLARPHLWNPHWTLFAAADLGYAGQWWPSQYLTGRRQFERIVERQKAER
jgi:anthraniloyl-CoA monooxygenase